MKQHKDIASLVHDLESRQEHCAVILDHSKTCAMITHPVALDSPEFSINRLLGVYDAQTANGGLYRLVLDDLIENRAYSLLPAASNKQSDQRESTPHRVWLLLRSHPEGLQVARIWEKLKLNSRNRSSVVDYLLEKGCVKKYKRNERFVFLKATFIEPPYSITEVRMDVASSLRPRKASDAEIISFLDKNGPSSTKKIAFKLETSSRTIYQYLQDLFENNQVSKTFKKGRGKPVIWSVK